jgi:hypothetical protein
MQSGTADIRSVGAFEEETQLGKRSVKKTVGVQVVFRAVPGMTAEWLQRLTNCHLARNAAVGHEAASSEMSYCPLTLNDVRATVRSVGDGFTVIVRSDDPKTVKEILRRSDSLRVATGPVGKN